MALPWRYRLTTVALPTRAPPVASAQFRCISDDPPGVGGDRGRVVALKLAVSASFRFVSDDPLAVGGRSRRSPSNRGVKTSSFFTISLRMVCRDAKSDDPLVGGVSWRRN